MRILLIRHGRSAHADSGGWLDRAGVERWRDAYDATGLDVADRPPAALVAEVARADVLVASDLARAVESARRLAPGRTPAISPLFREVPLPVPAISLRAPLVVWGTLIHLRWGTAILRRLDAPPAAQDRARAAAAWCAQAAREAGGGTIAVVTHGVFRRLLARRLAAEGWRPEPGRRGYAHWSAWNFRA